MSALVDDTPHKNFSEEVNENEVNFMLTPDMRPEIKNEPPEDFELINMDGGNPNVDKQLLTNGNGVEDIDKKPTITLTPTMKLMANPKPVDPKRKFPCPHANCTKSYGKSSHLRSHLTWHTGIKPYACREPNCGKSFTRSDELNRHLRTHTGEKPFECMQCAKKFSRSDHLTKHVATHTKQMHIQKRPRSRNQRDQLDNLVSYPSTTPHIATPKKLTAVKTELTEMSLPQEGLTYNDGMHFMASLLECAQFKHGRHVLEPENLTDECPTPLQVKMERPEQADECKVGQNDNNADKNDDVGNGDVANEKIENHQPVPTLLTAADIHPDPTYREPAKGLTLSTAAAGLVNALSVINSLANKDDSDAIVEGLELEDDSDDDAIMPEANAPPLPLAGAPLAVPRYDLREEDVDPERPYRCIECLKCFKRQDDLNRHVRTHTGEKPYACNNCSKRFMRSDHLKKHQKTHSKNR